MIYIENNLEKQDLFIPRNDGSGCYVSPYDKGYQDGYQDGIEDCGDCPIQQKEVVLTATTETISPDQGYAGMDSVFVDARQLALEKYNEGYHEGEEDGAEEQKDKLASTAFTQNGIYTREDGWSEVEVAVEQTGTTCNLESKTETVTADTQTILPSSGYDGMSEVVVDATDYGQDKYDEGFTDGQTDILSGMTATAFTQNDTYTNASGWSAVTVNVPQTGSSCNLQQKNITLESGDTSPWAVTPDAGYDGMSGVTITDNGYGQEKYEAGYDDGYEDAAGSACSLQDKTAQMTAATQTFYPDVSGVTVTGIQTDGYSWFDTGVYPNIDTKIEVSFTPFDRSFIPQNYQKSWGGIIGAQNQDDDNATFQIRFSATTSTILGRVGDGGDVGRFNTIYGARYTATLDKNAFILNGSQVPTNATSEDTCDYTIYISAINNGVYHHTWVNHRATPNIFHGVKIWQNNVLIRDYVPVVYNNSPCFYDTVNELYIYNIGSGTCSAVTGSTGLAYDGMASITVDASGLCQDYYDEGYQDGLNDCPACPQPSLEAVSYALPSGFTGTTITPSSGYDGMSSVAITDGGYGQEKYDEGYQDGLGDCPAPTLEQQSVTLTATTETVTPSQGYDGMDEVSIDASGLCQTYYNSGYTEGAASVVGTQITIAPDVWLSQYGTYYFTYDSATSISAMTVHFRLGGNVITYVSSRNQVEITGHYRDDGTLWDERAPKCYDSHDNLLTLVSNTYENGVGKLVFNDNIDRVGELWYNNQHIVSVTFPEGMRQFKTGTLTYCGLTALTIPSTVEAIEYEAFLGNNITEVTFPDGCYHIAYESFMYNPVSSITFGSGTTYIADRAFEPCGIPVCSRPAWDNTRDSLKRIYAYMPTPSSDIFGQPDPADPTTPPNPFHLRTGSGILYVPQGSSSYYQNWLTKLPSGWTISDTL